MVKIYIQQENPEKIVPDLRNALKLTLQAWYEIWNVMWKKTKQRKITVNNTYEQNILCIISNHVLIAKLQKVLKHILISDIYNSIKEL